MGWLDRVAGPFRHAAPLPTPEIESTRPELAVEKVRRDIEHRRTDRLARMLNDYRAQDNVFPRR